jgi:hypothetical protein
MQLDYIENINEYGDNIVRLYDFNSAEASKFRQSVIQTLLKDKESLDFATIDFIESRNCTLILRISEEDTGITTIDKKHFFCDMTLAGYENMVVLLDQFCSKETKGYQFLYDVDSQIDFLFSPAGTW